MTTSHLSRLVEVVGFVGRLEQFLECSYKESLTRNLKVNSKFLIIGFHTEPFLTDGYLNKALFSITSEKLIIRLHLKELI